MFTQIAVSNEQQINLIQKLDQQQRIRQRKLKKCTIPIFITKTYQILSNFEYSEIISWNNEGLNFIIHNVDRFQQQILPIHFRHRNFTSFVRQLNMYDFHKIRNDHNINIFEHKQFKKDQKECLKNIKRKGYNGIRKNNQQDQQQLTINNNNNNNNLSNSNNLDMDGDMDNISISDHDQFFNQNDSTPRKNNNKQNNEQDKVHQTVQSIGRISQGNQSNGGSINSILVFSPNIIQKKVKLEEFMLMIPDQIQTQQYIKLKIRQLKKDPYFECLNNKKDIRKLITKLRRRLTKDQQLWGNDLQELSIQEQIIADKINQDFHMSLTISLAILSTERMLSRNLLGSMNLIEDTEHLFWRKHY